MNLIIAISVFVCVLCVIEGLSLLLRSKWDPEIKRVKLQLKSLSSDILQNQPNTIMRNRRLSSIPWLNRILSGIPVLAKLDNLLLQANSRHHLGVFLLLSMLLALGTFYLISLLTRNVLVATPVAAAAAGIPFMYASMRKAGRIKKFQAQLPEALELMARSLRAGHAMVGGLQMVAQEFDDPMGTEIQKTVAQINFGVGVEQALKNLTERIDCPDLKFLAVSIIIQRESGGNLAEILESVGSLIRARFKLQGRIRTLAAEGKLSAIILTGIPFAVALVLSFMNPDYIRFLVDDPAGKIIVGMALLMMGLGVVVMKKMIAIKV